MANAQVVPNVISDAGNVMCVVSRDDGTLFGDVSQIAFANDGGPAGPASAVAQSADGAQLFFVPQPTDEPAANELVLAETDERLPLTESLTATPDSIDGARSLRTQMEVMQQAMTAFVADQSAEGTESGDLMSIYLAAMGDASLRLADSLDGMTSSAPPADSIGFADIIDGLMSESQSRMDDFLSTAFNF